MLKSLFSHLPRDIEYLMHRTTLLKLFLLSVLVSVTCTPSLRGQAKASGEVDAARCWAYPAGETMPTGLAADSGHIFIASGGATVETLNLEGRKLWSSELGGEITSDLLAGDGGLFLVTSGKSSEAERPVDAVLRSLSKATGVTTWSRSIPEAERHFLYLFNGWVIAVSTSGSIHAVDASTGAIVWKREITAGFAAQPRFSKTTLIVAGTRNQIFTIAMSSGEIESVRRLPFPVTALNETRSGEIIAGDERGNLTLLFNGVDKPTWRFKSGGEISAILDMGPNILAASHDNFVYYLVSRNGNVAWKRRLAGRTSHVIEIADGYALLASTEDHGAAIIELTNGKVVGKITFAEDEVLTAEPVVSGSLILAITGRATYAYSITGCTASYEGGTAEKP